LVGKAKVTAMEDKKKDEKKKKKIVGTSEERCEFC